jgi:uncharacterized protein
VIEPQRRLARGARLAWRIEQGLLWGVASLVAWPLAGALDAAPLRALPIAALLVATLLVPPLRYRRWRWDVHAHAIDIRHGTFTVRRTLVPLERVQHVETRRGILDQMLDLATVVVFTAAGRHTIPLLSVRDADELRDRIASLARTDA